MKGHLIRHFSHFDQINDGNRVYAMVTGLTIETGLMGHTFHSVVLPPKLHNILLYLIEIVVLGS